MNETIEITETIIEEEVVVQAEQTEIAEDILVDAERIEQTVALDMYFGTYVDCVTYCVVNVVGKYVELVNVNLMQYGEEIRLEPQCYTLPDGCILVDTEKPTFCEYAGRPGYIIPIWNGTQWTEDATASEITQWEVEHPAPQPTTAEVRAKRDKLLTATDWTQTLDAPISPASREAMRVYRQALRDITEQENFPADVVFPVEPVMEKAIPDPIDNAVDIMIGGEDNA